MTPEREQQEISIPRTVGELIARLEHYPLETPISFGESTLLRIRNVGNLVHFEFNEDGSGSQS
jgi:hypothetical protein